jgi:exopolyphosphatase/guanosine-5'-triphosphate,3'-diphosphate pyrophosphatase
MVARELLPTAFEVVDEERFDARLGLGQDDGVLTVDGMDRGAQALRLVSQVAASHGPTSVVAVGTEALRRAPNASTFIDRVRAETGLCIRVLSGEEEAFASYLGVVNSTGLVDGRIVDIGGGSLELIDVAGRQFAGATSTGLGALYATERYLRSDPPAPKEVRALRRAVREACAGIAESPALYAVGGAVRNLARIVRLRRRYPLRRIHGLSLSRREVHRLASVLAGASGDARRRIPGVSGARADILHAAAIVIDEVMDASGAESLDVSGQGLREGLCWQELRGRDAVLPDVRAASIAGLARANGVDALAAEPIVHAAAAIFEATQPAHCFTPADLGLLLDAARLGGIGMHIDYYDRDRHAQYLVHSGDLHGFSHREIVLLAAIVRWADAGTPDLTPYRALTGNGDERKAAVLASILGLARAVRRRVPSPVLGFRVALEGDALKLAMTGAAPLDAEFIGVSRQQKRFEATLKLELDVSAP